MKSKTSLIIDSSDSKIIVVGLKLREKKYLLRRRLDSKKSQAVLLMIEKLLKEHKMDLQDLSSIEVNIDPGSFTGIRVGVSIANALGFFLKVPINGRKAGELVTPLYRWYTLNR